MATPPERRLPRFGRTERTLHWVHAAAFLMLLATGLCLYLPSLAESVGRRPLLKSIHIYTAVAWAVLIVLVVLAGDRRAVRATVREIERLDSSRLNVGQKLNAIVTAAFAILFSVTGVLLWYGERDTRFRLPTALLVHDWLMDVSLFLFAGHLFLALIYPKTRHALSGMTRGWVDENWARRNHPRWAASLTDNSRDSIRSAELYVPVTPGPPPAHRRGE
jgi:formate dehydrogenase subunit gamma